MFLLCLIKSTTIYCSVVTLVYIVKTLQYSVAQSQLVKQNNKYKKFKMNTVSRTFFVIVCMYVLKSLILHPLKIMTDIVIHFVTTFCCLS